MTSFYDVPPLNEDDPGPQGFSGGADEFEALRDEYRDFLGGLLDRLGGHRFCLALIGGTLVLGAVLLGRARKPVVVTTFQAGGDLTAHLVQLIKLDGAANLERFAQVLTEELSEALAEDLDVETVHRILQGVVRRL